MKDEKTTLEFADGTIEEICGDIRDLALNQMAETLSGLGIPQSDIDAARAQCVAKDNDRPFMELLKKYTSFLR